MKVTKTNHSFMDRGKEYHYTKVAFPEPTPEDDVYTEQLAQNLVNIKVETYEIHSGPNLLKDDK